jgi:uncharacterized protein YgiM (DUF1202 family)
MEPGSGIGEMVSGTAVTRRSMLTWLAGAGAAVLGGAVTRGVSASSGSPFFRTTANLNLRAKASASGKILLVIPANAIVTNLGASSNGYNKVSYQGTAGWAYGAYLEDVVPDPDADFSGVGETTSAVNLRSGPGTAYPVIQVVKKGTHVQLSDVTQNGFRYVTANGTLGWIFDDYIAQSAEGGGVSFVTTSAVNLRAKPSTTGKILLVAPKGATVVDYDLVVSNGYRGVDYRGMVGWISDTYLREA